MMFNKLFCFVITVSLLFAFTGAWANSGLSAAALKNRGPAAVLTAGDPNFSRSLVIGKVFNDINGDGFQQEGESGIPGVSVASVSGLRVKTDRFGRYHLDDLQVERFVRGRSFILKVDSSTLPPGSTFTTENPRVVRLTQGMMPKMNFGVRLPASRLEMFLVIKPAARPSAKPLAAAAKPQPVAVVKPAKTAPQVEASEPVAEYVSPSTDADWDGDGVVDRLDECPCSPARARVNERGCWPVVNVLFDTDGWEIREEGRQLLDEVADILNSNREMELEIQGHSDSRGPLGHNLRLSETRSRAVIDYLVKIGIDRKRLRSAFFGYQRPVSDNATEEGRSLNRRVEFKKKPCALEVGTEAAPVEPEPPEAGDKSSRLDILERFFGSLSKFLIGTAHAGEPRIAAGAMAAGENSLVIDRRFFRYRSAELNPAYQGTVNEMLAAIRSQKRLTLVLSSCGLPGEEGRLLDRERTDALRRILNERLSGGLAGYKLMIEMAEAQESEKAALVEAAAKSPAQVLPRVGEEKVGYREPLHRVSRLPAKDIDELPRPAVWLTTDELDVSPALNVYLKREPLFASAGKEDAARFLIYCNYPHFVDRWQIEIFPPNSTLPVALLFGGGSSLENPHLWNLTQAAGRPVPPGRGYSYVLTVYDRDGHFDRTRPRLFDIHGESPAPAAVAGEGQGGLREVVSLGGAAEKQLQYDRDHTDVRNIPVSGGKVTIYGEGLAEGSRATIDGREVSIDRNGRFVRERIVPEGDHAFDIRLEDPRLGEMRYREETHVADHGIFMVGLADLTAGKTNFRGRFEPVSGSDEFDEKIYVDGRIAFYLKGKILGKYLLTARMDTGEEPVDDLFNQLDRKDPTSVFRRLDPDKYYPIYGDDAVTAVDAESQGQLYFKLEADRSHLMWGNYRTDQSHTDLARYRRSLYGAQLNLNSNETTRFDDRRTEVSGFWAEAQSVPSRDELRATGGSLYYLKHGDVVIGSERIHVEIREPTSGRVVTSYPMEVGRDYEIDWLQGRVVLTRALNAVIASQKLITNTPLAGEGVFLVAEYEYDARSNVIENETYGGRASHWLFDQLRLGGSVVNESRDSGKDYQLTGVDSTVKLARGAWLSGEWAESRRSHAGTFISNDGGLNYVELPQPDLDRKSEAWKVGLHLEYPEWTGLRFGSFYSEREAGFSAAAEEAVNDTRQYEFTLEGDLGRGYSLYSQLSLQDEELASRVETGTLQVGKELGQGVRITAEARHQSIEDPAEETLRDTLGAMRLDWQASSRLSTYAIQQLTLHRNRATPENNRSTLGAGYDVTDSFRVDVEGSTGNLGESVKVGGSYEIYDDMILYGNVERESGRYIGRSTTTTVGNRGKATDWVDVYTEQQITYGTYEDGVANVFGLDFAPGDHWSLALDYSRSLVEKRARRTTHRYLSSGATGTMIPNATLSLADPAAAGLVERDVFTFSAAYSSKAVDYRSKFQVRFDEGAVDLTQYVTTNHLDWNVDDNLTLLFAFDYSTTSGDGGSEDDARFTEGKLGFAYRPVAVDRFNLIGRYTYLENLAPLEQVDATNPDERSHVFSLEGIYDLSARWQFGEKFAYKRGEVRTQRDQGSWLDSESYLWVNRLNFHIVHAWDASVEYRMLWSTLADDLEQGFLLAAYRHLGKHAKLGAGYNFTDFEDDLTVANYDARGPFVNAVMKW